MPLSNDFTNTRLSYLQNAIKNSKVVAQQFYPRFVREYNEQFPYTEQKMSNIGNPISNTAVKGYLQEKTVQEVVSDLTTKIMSLTNDEEVTKYIGRELAKELSLPILSYLNDNFDYEMFNNSKNIFTNWDNNYTSYCTIFYKINGSDIIVFKNSITESLQELKDNVSIEECIYKNFNNNVSINIVTDLNISGLLATEGYLVNV
jgi:hypothetical protein